MGIVKQIAWLCFIMNLVYNWLVNYTHSDGKIIIPLKESSNDKGAPYVCIIEAVALGIWYFCVD